MFSRHTNTYHQPKILTFLLHHIWVLIFLLLFLSGTIRCQYKMYYPFGYSVKAKVARIIDGDTFVLSDSQRVRMLGIDTPELEKNGKPAEPFSDSAKVLTKQLIDGKIIKLTFDGKAFDFFGRLLAYVWLTNKAGLDSIFVQAELLKKGYARIRYYPKGKRYYDIFYNLRRTAMKNNLGIWSR
ncbi:thermonuclease family protein [Melioribacter sp. OK-6-Me]|uniref:thermonuclease family protein n=1 Tax=unclassified Melioribacter TaxID=2627329 RepID=UPI003EDB46B7